MRNYRFEFWSDGRSVGDEEFAFPDDLRALDKAETMATHHNVEVWLGGRLVARIEQSTLPDDVAGHCHINSAVLWRRP